MNRATTRIFCIAMVLVVVAASSAVADQVIKIGYVDVNLVFKSYMKTKQATKELDATYNTHLKEIDARKAEIEDLKNELKTKENILSQDRKDAILSTIRQKLADLQKYAKDADAKLRNDTDQRTRAIVEEIRKVVTQIATTDGYTVVFDKTMVLYAAPAFDLTQRVLDELNRNQPTAGSVPAE
ncbi:MAG: OmpH family outer membrane protein [Candidatus Hydrogenedentes bacterium]|nr:OmpH family outer membrane protein [Candidatus Hydrogenedentota bacterium]